MGAEKRSKAERMEGGKEDVKEALHRLMNRNPDSSAVLCHCSHSADREQ